MFRKLKRTWSHNEMNHIPNFDKVFPELSKISREELSDRLIDLGLDFYTEEETPVSFWTRITMPFAFLTMLLMLIGLPLCFLISGKWRYPLSDKSFLHNWFRAVRLQ